MKLMELYKDKIMGAISGLDRIHFRGTLRWPATKSGFDFEGPDHELTRREFLLNTS